jgi:hypothetical protein
MSFFQKSKILLKKTIHFIHFIHFGVRPPYLAGGVCDHYAAAGDVRGGHVETIMLRMIADDRMADALALL